MKLLEGLYVYPWLNPYENNANSYLLVGQVTTLVDVGHLRFVPELLRQMERDGLSPKAVSLLLSTHLHPDHHEGIGAFQGDSVMVAFHREEEGAMKEYSYSMYQLAGFKPPSVEATFYLQEGDLILGEDRWEVIHTPGHSPGSLCLYCPSKRVLITGDVLFYQGVGRTDLPGGDPQALAKSIRRLKALEVEYLLPGHGDILLGRDAVRRNFLWIEQMVLPYLL
ncbi:MAG: MBL fold metallo-hydrolase [Deltaproteobacteria bacterium]|nr:MAG: MBL fold metallo-hydrolase [Deltaproteobacteria bacterium]